MGLHKKYELKFFNCMRLFRQFSLFFMHLWFILFVFLILNSSNEATAQYSFTVENEYVSLSYDKLLVSVYLESNWSFNTNIIITNSDSIYINIEELFNNLEIPITVTNNGNKMDGFIENKNNPYSIDFPALQIKIGNKLFQLSQELVKESDALYLESSKLKEVFGLNFSFNPRSLSAILTCNFELPKIKQKKIEKTRINISKLRGEQVSVDTVIKREYHLFRFGMMDWGLASYQTIDESPFHYVSAGLGAELLYGEVNVSINYYNKYKFDNRQLQYRWRWVDNEKKLIKQAHLGNIYNHTIATVNFPVVGVNLRNSPTTLRKASGYYTINEYTEPNWTVELYINDVLVDYTVADALGQFVFKVPIVYGYTTLKIKFYSPMGEERIDERTINVPFTFMPSNTFEYGISAGIVQDDKKSRFGQGDFNYGVNRFLTVGGGVEYLSGISKSPFIPFAKVAFQPFSKLVFNLEYAHDVRIKGLMNFYFTQNAFLEIDYSKYVEGQMATDFNANEELKVRVSVPFKIKKVSGFTKLNFNHLMYQAFTYNQISYVFSAYFKNLSANSSTQLNWVSNNSIFSTTELTLSYKLKNGLIFRPSAQYNLSENNLMRVRAEIEKRVSKTYFSISYERNIAARNDNIHISIKHDFSFARTHVSASHTNNTIRFSESVQGSIAFGDNTLKTGNNSTLSKGGILFYPFLDLNQNGYWDKGEHLIMLRTVKISGGKAIISEKDSIVRVSNLNAFVNYLVEFNDNDLENIAWRFKYKTFQILVDPNQYKQVFVPVISVGEISGMVYLNKANKIEGLGRIIVQLYNRQNVKVAETLSERDGYFSFFGLIPDNYTVRIDQEQLKKLDYQSSPLIHPAEIKKSVDGDVVEGLEFMLQAKETTSSFYDIEKRVLNINEKIKQEEKFQFIKIVNKNELVKQNTPYFNGVIKVTVKKWASDFSHANLVSLKVPTNQLYFQKRRDIVADADLEQKTVKKFYPFFVKISNIDEQLYPVQSGNYRNNLAAKQLKHFIPIYFDGLIDRINIYFTGKYKSETKTEIDKNNIVEKEIRDAYTVALQNGIKLSARALQSEIRIFNATDAEYLLTDFVCIKNKVWKS